MKYNLGMLLKGFMQFAQTFIKIIIIIILINHGH